jgi:dihydroflavonol-4-reductase
MSLAVVTGASGFVGGVLVPMLLKQGHRVRAVDLRRGPALDGLDVEFARADVTDAASLAAAFEGAELAFHLVAAISIVGDPDGRVAAINVDGAGNAAAAAREAGVRRYVHCSSIHAFDLDTPGVIDETAPRSTRDGLPAYDRSKAAGERRVRAEVERGLDAVIVNPSGIIGPRDLAPSRMGHVFLATFRGRTPANVNDAFDWVDVRDVAKGLLAAAERGRTGQNYLLPGHRATVTEMTSACAAAAGVRPPRVTVPMWAAKLGAPLGEWVARRKGDEPLFTREGLHALQSDPEVSGAKAAAELGHAPRTFETSVADTYRWFRDQGALRNG